jgi:hypothetical protein
MSRVAVHTLHQHDAPDCDFGAEQLLEKAGVDPLNYEGTFARDVLVRLKGAVHQSLKSAQPVSHLGFGHGTGFQGGVEPPDHGTRRQGARRPLHRVPGSAPARGTGGND